MEARMVWCGGMSHPCHPSLYPSPILFPIAPPRLPFEKALRLSENKEFCRRCLEGKTPPKVAMASGLGRANRHPCWPCTIQKTTGGGGCSGGRPNVRVGVEVGIGVGVGVRVGLSPIREW